MKEVGEMGEENSPFLLFSRAYSICMAGNEWSRRMVNEERWENGHKSMHVSNSSSLSPRLFSMFAFENHLKWKSYSNILYRKFSFHI